MKQTAGIPETEGPRTMASMLSESILDDIVTGALAPGSKLKMRELAERYNAGVVPLREAVSRLAMSGFVEAEDQRGFRVSQVSRVDLADIMCVRQKIETDALRDAIANGGLEWEANLVGALHRTSSTPMRTADQPDKMNPAWERAHDHFHATLLEGSPSKWLKHFAGTLRAQSARYRYQSLRSPESNQRDVNQEHADIVQAVLARDADRACALLSEHFAHTAALAMASTAS